VNIFKNIIPPTIPKSVGGYLVAILFCVIYYFVVFHNGKWKKWAEKFQQETQKERRKNGIKVWIYCWGSIIFFFISLPITFSIINHLK